MTSAIHISPLFIYMCEFKMYWLNTLSNQSTQCYWIICGSMVLRTVFAHRLINKRKRREKTRLSLGSILVVCVCVAHLLSLWKLFLVCQRIFLLPAPVLVLAWLDWNGSSVDLQRVVPKLTRWIHNFDASKLFPLPSTMNALYTPIYFVLNQLSPSLQMIRLFALVYRKLECNSRTFHSLYLRKRHTTRIPLLYLTLVVIHHPILYTCGMSFDHQTSLN